MTRSRPLKRTLPGDSDGETVSMEIKNNGERREITPRTTVAQFLEQLQLSNRHVAVEVNLELVPRARHAQHALTEGDRLEVVSLVGGG